MSTKENAVRRYERALLSVWDSADDYAREHGARWYADARTECADIAAENGFTLAQVAGATAALSPRVHWSQNIADARTLARWAADMRDGIGFEIPIWSLGLNSFSQQSNKAAQILAESDPLQVLRGPKERAFYLNIMGNSDRVTVDMWATRAATRGAVDQPGSQYDAIAAAYRRAARKVNTTPRDFQAAVWITQRGYG